MNTEISQVVIGRIENDIITYWVIVDAEDVICVIDQIEAECEGWDLQI